MLRDFCLLTLEVYGHSLLSFSMIFSLFQVLAGLIFHEPMVYAIAFFSSRLPYALVLFRLFLKFFDIWLFDDIPLVSSRTRNRGRTMFSPYFTSASFGLLFFFFPSCRRGLSKALCPSPITSRGIIDIQTDYFLALSPFILFLPLYDIWRRGFYFFFSFSNLLLSLRVRPTDGPEAGAHACVLLLTRFSSDPWYSNIFLASIFALSLCFRSAFRVLHTNIKWVYTYGRYLYS